MRITARTSKLFTHGIPVWAMVAACAGDRSEPFGTPTDKLTGI